MTLARFRAALVALVVGATAKAQQPRPVVVIGGENDLGAAIGVIQDVAVLPRLLVVLEGAGPFVRVFDHRGTLIQTLGRTGDGPGEFRYPSAVTYDSSRREVLVTDRYLARVTRYTVTDTLAFRDVITSRVTELYGTCAMRGRLYTLGTFGEGMVHEISDDPARIDPVRSFGTRKATHPQGDFPAIRSRVAQGRMTCDESAHRIRIMNSFGDLHTIDVVGGVHTVSHANSFVSMKVVANSRGGITATPPDTGFWHSALGFVHEPEGMALVVGVRKPGGIGASRNAIASYATLALAPRGPSGPIVARAWQPLGRLGNLSICSIQDPYPTIAYFQQPRCP